MLTSIAKQGQNTQIKQKKDTKEIRYILTDIKQGKMQYKANNR